MTSLNDVLAIAYVAAWAPALGLGDWKIDVKPYDRLSYGDDEAYVLPVRQERYAAVSVDPRAPVDYVQRLVVHELLHLAHGELDQILMHDRSVAVMHLADDALEAFINTLSTTLTGIAYRDWRIEPEGVVTPDWTSVTHPARV